MSNNNSVAIACASGGFKAIFVHGVLSALKFLAQLQKDYGEFN